MANRKQRRQTAKKNQLSKTQARAFVQALKGELLMLRQQVAIESRRRQRAELTVAALLLEVGDPYFVRSDSFDEAFGYGGFDLEEIEEGTDDGYLLSLRRRQEDEEE